MSCCGSARILGRVGRTRSAPAAQGTEMWPRGAYLLARIGSDADSMPCRAPPAPPVRCLGVAWLCIIRLTWSECAPGGRVETLLMSGASGLPRAK